MAEAIFAASVLFLFYVFIGYPVLLLLWARWRPRPVRRSRLERSVTLILPVRNGAAWIGAKLQSIRNLVYPQALLQIVVASDGSSDDTVRIAREFPGIEVLELPAGGKCAAINAALERARGEVLFFTDVRQPLHPDCLAELISNFADPSVGVASGELIITTGELEEHARMGFYVRYEEWLRKRISEVGSVPGATGAVYAMRRHLAVPLPADCLLDDVYQPLAAHFRGYRVILDGHAIAYDFPVRTQDEFQRKVRTLAGLFQILRYYPQLLNPAHGIWIHFVSHKLARLLLPYAFALIALSSWFLQEPWRRVMLVAQVLFYGLAVADFWIPERSGLKRVSSLLRTFLTLLAASIAAGSILFLPARALWGERSRPANLP